MAPLTKPKSLGAHVAAVARLATGNLATRPPVVSQTPMDKIGVPPGAQNPFKAQVQEPAAETGKGALRQSATTYFTSVPQVGQATPELYSADRLWSKVTVTLETAGPVAVGFSSNLSPITSGKGILLTTDDPVTFNVAKGNKLYIQSTSVNRVKVQVESYPWLEQITGSLVGLLNLAKRFWGAS